jgi:hypothetical protein
MGPRPKGGKRGASTVEVSRLTRLQPTAEKHGGWAAIRWCAKRSLAFQQGESPCQERVNHPRVPSVAVMEEVRMN